MFPKGRATAHVDIRILDGEGNEAHIDPWIDKVPGLVEAIQASGLVLDPTGL
jgi:hypothetical protein